MRIKQNLINKYNHSQNLIVISSYPQKGEIYSGKVGGIASFAKNTVRYLPRMVVVIAEYFDEPEIYEEENSLVIRCFRRNDSFMWLEIMKTLFQFRTIRNILLQYDFALYGDTLTSCLVVPFLTILKLIGYRAFFVMHSVILDVFQLSGHLGLKNTTRDKIKGIFLNKIFHFFYLIIGFLAERVITTDEVLNRELSRYISSKKLLAIEHGVDTELAQVGKEYARRKLRIKKGEQMILFFGFVNWFKGADIYVSYFKNIQKLLDKKARFVIAGGESATLSKKDYYQEFYAEVKSEVERSSNIEITGFVPQEKIPLYFSACDLVVFPYRSFTSASGVLSLVLSYKKPFIVSSNIEGMLEAPDMKAGSGITYLRKNELVFDLSKESCLVLTEKVLQNGVKKKMVNFAQIIREKRDWKKTAVLYEQAIFVPSYKQANSAALALSYAKE